MSALQPESTTPAPAVNVAVRPTDPAAPPGFFQKRFVQEILPFLTSLSLHVGIILAAVLAFAAIKVMRAPVHNEITPAETLIVDQASLLGFRGTTADKPWLHMTQDEVRSASDGTTNSFKNHAMRDLAAAGGGAEGDAPIIAVGPTAFGHGATRGIGGRHDTGNLSGEGGDPARFGPADIGGIRNPIFAPAAVRRIAYVCDASGSMINKMPLLKVELAKAVLSLKPIQSFSVIFFQDTHPPIVFDSALVLATPQNKRKVGNFLDSVTTIGTTDPIPGIEAAFRQQPQLIYLLTDGDFLDNDAVLARITALNKGRKVRINTIAFVGSGDSDTAFIDLLKKIADENGGQYRHVSEEELQ